MSGGYLASVVERTLRPVEVIQPRLPTPFEPTASGIVEETSPAVAAGRPARPSLATIEAVASPPNAPAPAAPSLPAPARTLADTATERTTTVIERERVIASSIAVTRARPGTPEVATEPRSAPERRAGRDHLPGTPPPVAVPRAAVTPASQAAPPRPSPPSLPPTPRAHPVEAPVASPKPSPTPATVVEDRVTYVRVAETRIAPAPPASPPRVTAVPGVPLVTRRVATRPEASRAPEPIVHVTIGRVEIRGNAAPAPPPPRRPARTSGMPLDEYLAQRTRGAGS